MNKFQLLHALQAGVVEIGALALEHKQEHAQIQIIVVCLQTNQQNLKHAQLLQLEEKEKSLDCGYGF